MKTLGGVYHYDAYTDAIQAEVMAYFRDVLVTPLESKLADLTRRNSHESDALKIAIAAGLVWYTEGAFHGRFNAGTSAALSKMGARFRKRSAKWEIPVAQIPLEIRQAIYQAKSKTAETIAALAALVLLMRSHVDEADTGISLVATEKRILDAANDEFNKALKDFDADRSPVGIPSEMKGISEEIEQAAKEDAKRVMKEELDNLADELATLKNEDAPLDEVKKTVERLKHRLALRTRTLSEHAAALLLSQFRKAQAKRLGLSSYVWKTKRDNRVRHDHRELEGKTFRWDDPPITNQRTGDRNHPGEDINCRCVPLNIIPSFNPTG